MIEKEHFIKPIEIEITAATIGINSEDWFCYKPGDRQDDIIEVMKKEKYDIVPILNKAKICTSYFTYINENLLSSKINNDDKIYYLTHIRDVIWMMNEKKRSHYFLSNGRNENDIVGLISLSNFNSRDFYLYLFNTIAFLEIEFANLIESKKDEAFFILKKLANTVELSKQLEEIESRIAEDEKYGTENDYKEYLYFSNLVTLLKYEESYRMIGYSRLELFEKNIGILKDIRNAVAHPVKSLVNNFQDLEKINKGVSKIFELREQIKKYKHER